jgi:Ser-tRNA(Ala) deacylase AlaX
MPSSAVLAYSTQITIVSVSERYLITGSSIIYSTEKGGSPNDIGEPDSDG